MPTVGKASVHFPTATPVLHDVVPSVTVTVPVSGGPALSGDTLNATVTDWPTTEGLGLTESTSVEVFDLSTTWTTEADAPPENCPSPT